MMEGGELEGLMDGDEDEDANADEADEHNLSDSRIAIRQYL